MKTTVSYFAIISTVMWSITLAHAEPKSCDEKMPSKMSGVLHGKEGMMFQNMDANGDGTVTKGEFKTFNNKRFKEMDANQDGKLTPEDMHGPAGHQPGMSHGDGMGQGAGAGHNDGTSHLDQRFKAADANQDGGLDRAEAKNMPMLSMYYDEVDANKDNKVTRQEYFDAMPLLHGGKKMEQGNKPNTL
jgi:hypothetical protein